MKISSGIAAAVLACLVCVPAVVDAPTTTAGPVAAVITTDTTVCSVPTVDNGMCRSGGRFTAGSRMTPGRITLSDNYVPTN